MALPCGTACHLPLVLLTGLLLTKLWVSAEFVPAAAAAATAAGCTAALALLLLLETAAWVTVVPCRVSNALKLSKANKGLPTAAAALSCC
jgi:hypothetical protein